MNRLRAFCVVCLLFDLVGGFGQSPCAPKCAPTKYAPISGRVTDAVDGHPLANALVSYQGLGDGFPSMDSTVALNPPSVKGSARTASDGSYALPLLPPLGGYEVRVSAPGYLSSQEFLGEPPVGYHPQPIPMLAFECMAKEGRPDCTMALPDGKFKLQQDVLELRQMTSALPQDLSGEFRRALQSNFPTFYGNRGEDDSGVQTTVDGQFQLISGEGEGRQCNSLTIATKRRDWKRRVSTCSFGWDYLLDREHDFLVLYEPRRLAQDEPPFQKLTLLDLKASSQRSYLIPETNSILQLLAEQRLADGATRVAYSIEGECDPASPDAAHTATFGQPVNGNKPRNLCFVRIPTK